MNFRKLRRFLLVLVICAVIATAVSMAFLFDVALQAGLVVVVLALLWIAWELHRIAQITVNFMRGWEDAILAREQAEREPSLAPAPEHRIPNPDMTGWKSAQKSQNL